MAKNAMGFEFGGFRRPTVDVEYKPNPSVKDGQGVKLKLNLDLITLERMQSIEAEFNELFDDSPKQSLELADGDEKVALQPRISLYTYEKALFNMRAALLVGKPGADDPNERFIYSWNVVRDGKPLPVAFESLTDMPTAAVADLYNFVTGRANNPSADEKKESAST